VARLRNISGETLFLPDLGRSVEPDELFEVDDALFHDRAWPESLYKVTAEPKRAPADPPEGTAPAQDEE
jgi:hypothetical protein